MQFAKILNELMEKRKITAYRMHKDTNIPEATIGRWKKGKVMPSQDKLVQIADYFKVSTDYLLGNEQKEKPATDTDDELTAIFRTLPKEAQRKAIEYAKFVLAEEKADNS